MPLALLAIGLVLLITGLRGTTHDLFALLKGDFTGPGNYFYWVAVVVIVGSVGYIKKFQPVSDAFLVLIVVILALTKGKGVFSAMNNAFANPTAPTSNANSGGVNLTTQQALDAAKSAPGAGFGFTMPQTNPGQIVPSPFAFGPI